MHAGPGARSHTNIRIYVPLLLAHNTHTHTHTHTSVERTRAHLCFQLADECARLHAPTEMGHALPVRVPVLPESVITEHYQWMPITNDQVRFGLKMYTNSRSLKFKRSVFGTFIIEMCCMSSLLILGISWQAEVLK